VSPLPFGLFAKRRREEEKDRRKEGCVAEASILRKHGRPTITKEQRECGRWIQTPGRPRWNRDVPMHKKFKP
jgi:hypothetical protein